MTISCKAPFEPLYPSERTGATVERYVQAAVGKREGVGVTGHALLLAVLGAGGGGPGVARVDVVRVDGSPPRGMPGNGREDTRP